MNENFPKQSSNIGTRWIVSAARGNFLISDNRENAAAENPRGAIGRVYTATRWVSRIFNRPEWWSIGPKKRNDVNYKRSTVSGQSYRSFDVEGEKSRQDDR